MLGVVHDLGNLGAHNYRQYSQTQGHHQLSRAISHHIWFGLNEGHNAYSCLGSGKLFNVLQSLIGRMASRPMRNIETFPSNQMYLCLSLVERKVAEFYLNDLFSLLFPDN